MASLVRMVSLEFKDCLESEALPAILARQECLVIKDQLEKLETQ